MNGYSQPEGPVVENHPSLTGNYARSNAPGQLACNYSSTPNPDSALRKYAVLSWTGIEGMRQSFISTGQRDRLFLTVSLCQSGTTTHFAVCGTKTTLAKLQSCNPAMRPTGNECSNCSQLSRKPIYATVKDVSSLMRLLTFIIETLGASGDATIQYTELPEQAVSE